MVHVNTIRECIVVFLWHRVKMNVCKNEVIIEWYCTVLILDYPLPSGNVMMLILANGSPWPNHFKL